MSANLQVNKFKNRLVNILPFESSRVCLQPLRGIEGSDYINASFIDGYRYRYGSKQMVAVIGLMLKLLSGTLTSPHRGLSARLWRTSGACCGSTTPPSWWCWPSSGRWDGWAHFFSFQFLKDLCNGMDKSVWKEIIAIERISFYTFILQEKCAQYWPSERSARWETSFFFVCIFFSYFFFSVDISTLWWTPWQSTTCLSTFSGNSRWQRIAYFPFYTFSPENERNEIWNMKMNWEREFSFRWRRK